MDLAFKQDFCVKQSATIAAQITEFLTNAIIQGELKMGQRLVENDLMRRFRISRAPIRESFRMLERNGLLAITPRKGAYVRRFTPKDIKELYPIRAQLEGLAAHQAVENLGPEGIEAMKITLSRLKEMAEKNDNHSYNRYHDEFHEIFIKASKNDTLIDILTNMRRQAIWAIGYDLTPLPAKYIRAHKAHENIVELFVKRDADGVEALVREHILLALPSFLQFLEAEEAYPNTESVHKPDLSMGDSTRD